MRTRFASVAGRTAASFCFIAALLAGCSSDGPPAANSAPAAATTTTAESSKGASTEAAAPPAAAPETSAATPANDTPPAAAAAPTAEPVRAAYASGWTAGGTTRWAQLLDLCDKTELNALVIDVREDGMVSYDTDVALAKTSGAHKQFIRDMDAKVAECKKRGVYSIARITVFRDKIVPRKRPDLAIQFADGRPWRDRAGHYWLDPYNQTNWDYAVDVASDAAKRGFNEVQWDYVRFPSEGKRSTRRYPARPKDETRSEAQVIAAFCKYAKEKLAPTGVKVSADVFGLTTSASDDLGIGQRLELMAPHLDVVCPMVYPSHYGRGAYSIAHPNASPYKTVFIGLKAGMKRLKGTNCVMRPWLQDFSLGGVRYGEKQVRAQIEAARANGVNEYLLWNASNRYTTAALVPPKRPRKSVAGTTKESRTAGTKGSVAPLSAGSGTRSAPTR